MRIIGCICIVFLTLAFLSCSDEDEKGNLVINEPGTPTLLVTNYSSDGGPGTLREVISNAPSGAIIGFTNIPWIYLSNSIEIKKSVTIYGGFNSKILIHGTNHGSTFIVNEGCKVVFANVWLYDGAAVSGGAINNSGTVTLQNCWIRNNIANSGGAIRNYGSMNIYNSVFATNAALAGSGGVFYNTGDLNIVNCTFTGNYTASTRAGGVLYHDNGNAKLSFCTIVSNHAENGGAIYVSSSGNNGSLHIRNCIFANNAADVSGPNINGDVDSLKYSIVDDTNNMTIVSVESNKYEDPMLYDFAWTGDGTGGFALQSTSPARNAGDPLDCNGYTVPFDQRGETRPMGTAPDMGAFEYDE